MELRAESWYEVTSGRSLAGYKALDVYVQMCTYLKQQQQEAWYLLNVTEPPEGRVSIPPEEWYRCLQWVSMGQKDTTIQWYLQPVLSRL